MAIVVVGNVFVDIKGFPYDKYIPDGRNSGWVETVHGGVGRNVAEDIANAGYASSLLTMVDDTDQGEAVINRLIAHNVSTEHVMRTKDGMGIWLAVFDNTGDIAGSISKRPDMGAMARYIEENGDRAFSSADSVVLEFDVEPEISEQTIELAHKYGKKVIALVANISIAAQRRDLISKVDYFICNRLEAGLLFGQDLSELPENELRELVLDRIKRFDIKSMIVTMGPQGAVYAEQNGNTGFRAAKDVDVKDTSGAGDAFCAGAAIGLTYGNGMEDAMTTGTQLAASVLSVCENVCPACTCVTLGAGC